MAHIAEPTRKYIVDLNFQTCECKAFEKEGYCKHTAMVQAERAYLANLDAQAEAQAELDLLIGDAMQVPVYDR